MFVFSAFALAFGHMSVLLSEQLNVRISPAGKDEYHQTLAVKISGGGSGSLGSRISIELTSDADLFFYFSVVLTDGDFHAIKTEQRLLVDFHQFPEMIRQLLKAPAMSLALLIDVSGEAVLSVVEANQFRELTHLSLRMKRGNDEMVKSHLATRLGFLKCSTAQMESELTVIKNENKKLLSDRDTCLSELGKLRADTEAAVSAIQSTCRAQIAELREDHAKELRDIHLSTSSEHSSETRRLYDEVREKDVRGRDMERRLDETRLTLASMEMSVKSSHQRVASLERELDVTREQLKRAEIDKAELASQNAQQERRIAEAENAKQQFQLVHQSSATTTSDRVCMLERENEKKDATIAKLQAKYKEAKMLLKETQHALLQQERVVQSLTSEVERATMSKAELENKLLKQTSLMGQNSSQMVSYINHRLNETSALPLPSVHYTGSLLSSPSVTPGLNVVTPGVSGFGTGIPEFPNRSQLLMKNDLSYLSDSRLGGSHQPTASAAKAPQSRQFSGPVKFTARSGKEPLIK